MKSTLCLILLIIPALHAQSMPDVPAGRGVNFYSIKREATLGAQSAREFAQQNRILDSVRLNSYLTSVGQRLLKEIPETGFSFQFAAFADSEKGGLHEIRVLPGAYLYVPVSLILAARDEAEFAGMLAHAVVHAANRDATRQASRAEVASFATIPMVVNGGRAGYDAQQPGQVAALSLLQFQRGTELEADFRAVAMMAAAGWDPVALARYIEREQPAADPRKPGTTARVFSPVPPPEERVAAIRKAIAALPSREYSTSPEFAAIQEEVRRPSPDQTPAKRLQPER